MDLIAKFDELAQAAGGLWTRVNAAKAKLLALESSVETLVANHPELKDDVTATFAALGAAVATHSPTSVFGFIGSVEQAYTDGVKAYTGEAGALADLLAKLKAVAN